MRLTTETSPAIFELDEILSKPFTLEEIAKARIRHMNIAIEIGCCTNIRQMIEDWRNGLENLEDPSIRARYVKILEAAKLMFEIEERHGAGSLLKLHHPIVVRLLERSHPSFLPTEIVTARKYQAVMAMIAA